MSRISILTMRPPKRPVPRPPVPPPSPAAPRPAAIEETAVIAVEEAPEETPVVDETRVAEETPRVDETEADEPAPKEITRSFLNTRNKADLVKFGQELGLELDLELRKTDLVNRIATHIGI